MLCTRSTLYYVSCVLFNLHDKGEPIHWLPVRFVCFEWQVRPATPVLALWQRLASCLPYFLTACPHSQLNVHNIMTTNNAPKLCSPKFRHYLFCICDFSEYHVIVQTHIEIYADYSSTEG